MHRLRRIAAYGLCRDDTGRVLLVRASSGSQHPGRWFLPGGGVEHGEHPADAAVREIEEETGLRVAVERVREVVTDVDVLPDALRHQDRLVFDCHVIGGTLRHEPGGSTDHAEWVAPERLVALPLMPYVVRVLGLPGSQQGRSDGLDQSAGVGAHGDHAAVPERFQRFASYGLVTDPDGRVLLTLIAEGYPGAGRWHLPGGGTDFGEDAADGLRREVVEETGQQARITDLLTVSHRRHNTAFGPEGVPIDWHGVRVVFRAVVDHPTAPRVVEARGGSTAEAVWLTPARALGLPLTEVAHEMIDSHLR